MRAIKEEFGDQVEVTTITHQDRTVCSVMSFRYGNEILPYYGGGGELARDLKGNDFMYWAVMERACQDGIEVFDYGRSMVGSGAYRFKKHWGFEPEPLHYQYFLVNADSLPNLNPCQSSLPVADQYVEEIATPDCRDYRAADRTAPGLTSHSRRYVRNLRNPATIRTAV